MRGPSTGQKMLGVVVGIIVAVLIVGVIEAIGHRLFPPPSGLDLRNPDDLHRLIQAMPAAAKSIVLGAWFAGAFVGGWVAMTLAQWRPAPWIVAGVILAGGIWSMVMIPHPLWMMAAGIVLPLLGALLASRRADSL